MKRVYGLVATAALAVTAAIAFAADAPAPKSSNAADDLYSGKFFKAEESVTSGSAAGIS